MGSPRFEGERVGRAIIEREDSEGDEVSALSVLFLFVIMALMGCFTGVF